MSKTRSYAEPSGKPSGYSWDYESPAVKWGGALTSRAAAQSHEVQVRVEDVFDEELDGLRGKVSVLKGVAQGIESETRSQNDHLSQLELSMAKAQAGISNSMKRLNRSLAVRGSGHLTHVVLFALVCFLGVYIWARFLR